ncbi:class I SAM-dependent methyltransferase [Segnochrobactraceae bacterium EtOH-i3]
MWDARFSGDGFFYGTRPNAFLTAEADRLPKSGTVLSVAEGEGRNAVWLAERGLEVTAVDASAVGLAKAERLAAERGVALHTVVADLATWEFPAEAFDVVVAIFIQFAPPAVRDHIFAGMIRALKPGGLLLMQGYRTEQLAYGTGGPKVPELLYTVDLVQTAFASLTIRRLDAHDAEISEGTAHHGMSALLDLVAIKPL